MHGHQVHRTSEMAIHTQVNTRSFSLQMNFMPSAVKNKNAVTNHDSFFVLDANKLWSYCSLQNSGASYRDDTHSRCTLLLSTKHWSALPSRMQMKHILHSFLNTEPVARSQIGQSKYYGSSGKQFLSYLMRTQLSGFSSIQQTIIESLLWQTLMLRIVKNV